MVSGKGKRDLVCKFRLLVLKMSSSGSHTYYSNGKLLLTGEYVVLDGALSLALPTLYGQYLRVTEIEPPKIIWNSLDEKNTSWFKTEIHTDLSGEVTPYETNAAIHDGIKTNAKEITGRLLTILKAARKLNPSFLKGTHGYEVTTMLSFPRNWGLGSSSTLINNIAQWAKVDAFTLLFNSFPGSGYDIACAQHYHPLTYQLHAKAPVVKQAKFHPSFAAQLYFVHLNKKQDSSMGIEHYRAVGKHTTHAVQAISDITRKIERTSDLNTFETLIEAHEDCIADLIKLPKVKTRLFKDYPGKIKSLGAWGGDFILATGNAQTLDYFRTKGYNTIVPYDKMIRNHT